MFHVRWTNSAPERWVFESDWAIDDTQMEKNAAEWDAGEMGCGELILELKLRLTPLPPGAIFTLIARDPGVPEDLPAWCRMTGHSLLRSAPPEFLIKRKPS